MKQISASVNRSAIQRVTAFKYLGVIFGEHLSLNEHVKAIISKAGRRVGMLDRARRYVALHSAAYAIYILTVRPILEYCAGSWAYSRGSKQPCRSEHKE